MCALVRVRFAVQLHGACACMRSLRPRRARLRDVWGMADKRGESSMPDDTIDHVVGNPALLTRPLRVRPCRSSRRVDPPQRARRQLDRVGVLATRANQVD
eukprot:scaffold8226_cov114-Isochrysis_galbana.AAC.7